MISVSTNTDLFAELKQEIAKKFGKTPDTQKDLELLRIEIKEEVNIVIGFNTLRRFFGKLEKRKPQINTLNLLSIYLGFKNFQDFTKHYNKNDEWYTWKKMTALENQDALSAADTEWLNSVKLKRDYPVMISYLLKSYINNEQYNHLQQLFASDCLLGLKYENQMKIGNSLGLFFRKLPLQKHEQLYKNLRYFSFRNIALYLFVDYDSFNGYYINLIRKALKLTSDSEEQLFLQLIVNYKKFLCCKGVPADFSTLQIPKTIHPILYGRYYGYRICTADSSLQKATIKEMLAASKSCREKISFFLEIIPSLLLTGKIKLLQQIFDEYYTALFDMKYWSQNDEIALYRIGEAFIHIYNTHYTKAQRLLKSIDLSLLTDSYYSYATLFFKIAEYQTLSGLQTETDKLKIIEQEYHLLVSKTGFKRFSTALLKNYFSNN